MSVELRKRPQPVMYARTEDAERHTRGFIVGRALPQDQVLSLLPVDFVPWDPFSAGWYTGLLTERRT